MKDLTNNTDVPTLLKAYNYMMVVAHSSGIEGSTLSFDDTKDLIINGMVRGNKSMNDYDMVRDHYEALLYITACAKSKKILTQDIIQETNRRVMKNTGSIGNNIFGNYDTSSGEFRKVGVSAGSRIFPDPTKIPAMIEKFVSFFNEHTKLSQEKDIRSFAVEAHYNLVSIHPFLDGNGRTGRLIMNYVEAYHGLDLTIILCQHKQKYIGAIEECRKKEMIDPLLCFMEKNRQEANELLKKYIEESTITTIKNKGSMKMMIL